MAVAVRYSAVHEYAFGTTGTVTFGGTPVDGDLIVFAAMHRAGGDPTFSVSTGSGWTTEVGNFEQADGTFRRGCAIAWKVASSEAGAAYTMAFSGDPDLAIVGYVFSGLASGAKLAHSLNSNGATANGTTVGTGSTSSVSGNILNVVFAGVKMNSATPAGTNTDFTFANATSSTLQSKANTSNEVTLFAAWEEVASASGAQSDTATMTATSTVNNGLVAGIVTFQVEAAATSPTISSVTPSTIAAGSNPVIAGTNFEASQGTGTVKLSPTDNVADANAVTQTITSWGDTSITLNGVSFPAGTAHNATLYLFVTNDTGDSNAAGSVVTASLSPTIHTGTVVNPSAGGFSVRFNSDVANGTAYYVVFQTTASDPSAAQIVAGTDGDGGAAVASGSMAISTTGEQTFPATTGLTQSVTYRVAVVHYGDSSA